MQYRQRDITTTMCIKRAGLVWALLLLTTTYFILTCAVPSDDKTGEHNPDGSEDNGHGNITEEHPSVSTIPPVASMEGVDSSQKSTKETSDTPAVSNDPNSDDDTDEYLYYEIKRRIFYEHNLNLSDINYVLSQKDDGRQFMYALADKLGYMSEGGKSNDPHIPVIRSHRDKLIKQLEKMVTKKVPKLPVSQEGDEGPSVSSNEMPTSKEPPSLSDTKKIGYEVSGDIRDLGPDVIREILSELTFSDALGYAVGDKLGYLQGDEHMKYLENANADELRKILQRTLESKTTGKTIPSELKQPNEPTPIPPTVKPPNIESGGSLQSTEAPSVSDKSELGPNDGSDDINEAGNVPSIPGDSGPVPPTSLNSEESDDHGAADQAPGTEGEGETSPSKGYMRNSEDNDGNEERPLSKDLSETNPSAGIDYDDDGIEPIPKIDEAKRTSILNSKDFQKYLADTYSEFYKLFMNGEADSDDIDMVLEEYLASKDEKGVSEDSSKLETGGDHEPKEGEGYGKGLGHHKVGQ